VVTERIIALKKAVLTSNFVNSRLALKAGSVLFLLFFVFFSLAAPLVAQFGSALFIFLGMVLAPLLHQDQAADDQLPLRTQHVYQANAFEWAALPTGLCRQTDFAVEDQATVLQRSNQYALVWEPFAPTLQTSERSLTPRFHAPVFPIENQLYRRQPARASPYC